MNLTLVVDTSVGQTGIVFGNDAEILFDSHDDPSLMETRDLSFVTQKGLNAIGASAEEIATVAVNIGPGGLSSVRSGVAFANALSFGLGIPVCPCTSFDLMGFESWGKLRLPVVCSTKAFGGNSYIGIYRAHEATTFRYGLLDDIIPELTQNLDEFSVAGVHRNIIQKLLPNKKINDSGIQFGRSKLFFEIAILVEY